MAMTNTMVGTTMILTRTVERAVRAIGKSRQQPAQSTTRRESILLSKNSWSDFSIGIFADQLNGVCAAFFHFISLSLSLTNSNTVNRIGTKSCNFRLEAGVKPRGTNVLEAYILVQRLRYWFKFVSRLVSPRLLIGFQTRQTAPFKPNIYTKLLASCAYMKNLAICRNNKK